MRFWKMLTAMFVFAAMILALGCGGQEQQEPAETEPETETTSVGMEMVEHTPGAEEIGMTATCPVTGMEFTVADTTKAVMYKDTVYYFMDQESKTKFMENPEMYMTGMAPDTLESMTKPDSDRGY
jgi:YHS domain-containing protein